MHASEDNKSTSSGEGVIPSSTGECSLDKKDERDDLGDCCTEQPEVKLSNGVSSTTKQAEDVNLSDKLPSSMEQPEDKNLSNEVSSPMKHCDDVNISDERSSYKVQPEVKLSNGVSSTTKQAEDVNLSDKVPSSMEQPEDKNLSNEVSSPMKHCDDVNISDERSSYKVQPEDVNSSNEVSLSMEHTEDVNISNEGSSSIVQCEDVNSSNEVSSPTEHPEDVNFSSEVSSPMEQPGDMSISNEGSSSMEHPEDVNSSNEVSLSMEHTEDVNISNEGSSSIVQCEDVNSSNEVSSPTEHPEDVNFSSEVSSPMEQPGDMSISNEGSSSMEHPEDVNSSNEVSLSMEHTEDVNISNEGSSSNVRPDDVKFSSEVSSSLEKPEDVSFSKPEDVFSNEVSSPTEQPETVNFSNEVSLSLEQPVDVEYSDEVPSTKEQSEDVDFSDEVLSPKEPPEDKNISNEVSSSKQQQPTNVNFLNEVSSSTEKPEDVSYLNEVSLSTELTCHENEEPRPIVGTNSVDEDDEGGCHSRSLSSDSLLASREKNSEITVQRLTGECMKQGTPISCSNEKPEKSEDDVLHGFERVRSVDTLESTEVVNPSSELSDTLRYMYRSPTSRSFYGYDGSVSSYDGTDDQVLDQPRHQPNRTFKARKFVGPEERSRGNFLVNGNLEMQSQVRNPSSILSGKERYPERYSKWNRDDFLESTNYDQLVRNWRSERGEFPSRSPFYGRDFPAGYENDDPLSPGHPNYQCSSSFHSPNKPEFHEHERIKLLKIMCELQDEIARTNNVGGPTRAGWKGKHIAWSYNHEASEEEIFNDLNYPRYPDQYRTGRNWSQQRKFSRMALSGEAPNSRLHADYSCLHCCPQDRWYSAQLPPPVPSCKNELHGAHPTHRCYHHRTSTHSSPLQCMDSEMIPKWIHGAKSEDQGRKNHEAKLYRKEKLNQVKRHMQPIAGGAPFLTCYHCSHLLQLPADFLLFKRRCHRLRCGACYELLKFSVEDRTHIVRYTPNAVNPPPPSEVDDNSRILYSAGLASTALANERSSADPVSCSDDYGLSFCKSFSTEGEPAFTTSPFEPKKERNKKLSLKRSLNKHKKPVETNKSIGPSSNLSNPAKSSTEIEELSPTTGSPLFRLMDYSSPNALIYGCAMDSD